MILLQECAERGYLGAQPADTLCQLLNADQSTDELAGWRPEIGR